MSPLDVLLKSGLVPGAAAALVLLLAAFVARRSGRSRLREAGAGLAVFVAFAVGMAWVEGWPSLPLADGANAWTWVAWIGAAGLLVGWLGVAVRLPSAVALFLRAALALGAAWAIVAALVPHSLEGSALVLQLAVAALGTAMLWQAAAWASSPDLEKDTAALPLLIAAGGLATTLLIVSGAAIMGQVAGALAAGLGATYVLAFVLGRPALGGAGAAVAVPVLGALWLSAYAYLNWEGALNFPFLSALLPAAGALLGMVLPRVLGARRSRALRIASHVLPPLLGAALGLWIASTNAPLPTMYA